MVKRVADNATLDVEMSQAPVQRLTRNLKEQQIKGSCANHGASDAVAKRYKFPELAD